MQRDPTDYLNDIIDNIDKIYSFLSKISFQQFVDNEMIHYAVIKALEIIGEAANNIPNNIQNNYNEINWIQIYRWYFNFENTSCSHKSFGRC